MIFNLDDNSDRFDSFKVAESYFRKNGDIKVIEYYAGGWSTAYLKFEKAGIYAELIYQDFGGTELRVGENISENEVSMVHQWAEDVHKEIHKADSPS